MKEGPLSFWRGNGTNVLKIVPESACKFFAYDMFMRAIVERTEGEVRARERERKSEREQERERERERARERARARKRERERERENTHTRAYNR